MSTPKWDAAGDNVTLADTGYNTSIGSPETRAMTHSIPRVNGIAIGLLGLGGRILVVTGFLQGANGQSGLIAMLNVKSALRDVQEQVGSGSGIKSFTDSDSSIYTFCILESYDPTGPPTFEPGEAGTFIGRMPIQAVIRQQEATNP